MFFSSRIETTCKQSNTYYKCIHAIRWFRYALRNDRSGLLNQQRAHTTTPSCNVNT